MPNKRKTHEYFLKELENLKEENIIDVVPLEKYITGDVEIKFFCNKHKKEFISTPNYVLRGRGCEDCLKESHSRLTPKTRKNFEKKLKEVSPHIKLKGEYCGRVKMNTFFCEKHNETYIRRGDVALRGFGCDKCKEELRKEQHKEYIDSILDKFLKEMEEVHPNYKILSEFDGYGVPITVQCEKGHIWSTNPANLLNKKKPSYCPYCVGFICLEENSIYSLRPDLIKYFENPEDAKTVPLGTVRKIDVRCDICGHPKTMEARNLVLYGFGCPVCGDGISYANKFIRALLMQFDIDYHFEYMLKDSNTGIKSFYDAMFYYKDVPIFIEMDGELHRESWFHDERAEEDLKKHIEKDKIKDEMVKDIGGIIIRIPFEENEKYKLDELIKQSDLSKYLNLEKVDWKKCREYCESSLVKEVCDYYNNNPNMTNKEIREHFHIGSDTLNNYVKRGEKLGWCIYRNKKQVKTKCVFDRKNYEFETFKECFNFIHQYVHTTIKYITNHLGEEISKDGHIFIVITETFDKQKFDSIII